jgi:hypothetical protein
MSTSAIYVDISNDLDATPGTGTSASPFNYVQCQDHYYDVSGFDLHIIYYMKGLRQITQDEDLTNYGSTSANPISASFLPWDMSTYGPWIISAVNGTGEYATLPYWNFEIYNEYDDGTSQLVVDGLVVHVYDFTFWTVNNTAPEMSGFQHVLKNSYIYVSHAGKIYLDELAINPVKILGCTFKIRYNKTMYIYQTAPLDFVDCFFDELSQYGLYYYSVDVSAVSFSGCYFVNDLSATVATDYQLSSLNLDDDCVTSFELSQSISGFQNITDTNYTDYDYTNYGLSAITDTDIINRWTTLDYNDGFFSSSRQSVGAFYFHMPPFNVNVLYTVYPKLSFVNNDFIFSANLEPTGTFDPTWTSAYTVLYGDGQYFTSTSAIEVTRSYANRGNYVSIHNYKITSATGETYYNNTSAIGNIKVNPIPEIAFTGYSYVLSGLSFYDVKGGYYITDTVVSANWDFGDGSLSSTTDLDAILIHSYSAVGNYTVSVSAYDVSGNVGVGSDVVGILEGANCVSKEDYITLCGPGSSLARYGNSRFIDLKTYLPDYLKDGEVEEFIEVFEDFLNEMYDGQDGWINSATSELPITETWNSNSATSGGPTRDFTYDISGTTVDTEATDAEQIIVDWPVNSMSASPKISILEKVYRLTELHDPDLIDLEYIQYFAKNLGYNVNVYRDELGISGTYASSTSANSACTDNETNRYIRFVVQNLPTWYKIKTTRNAIKVMLYSFGLVGDILEYYTSNYKSYPEGQWKLDSETDLRNIPDNWYPTPHFALLVDLDTSTDISFDLSRRDKVIRAIESIRPINTVFKRLVGYAKRTFELTTAAWIRMTRYTDIRSDGYSNSWWDGTWY